jgi:DNA mismatch repair protein MutL
VIIDQALANPHIGVIVKNNAKEQLHVPANSNLLQRIAGLFGRDISRELLELHESAGSLEVRGFIGFPSCNRANRNYQKLFVNNRPVKDKTISHAIQQAYDTLIPKRRYPVVFIFLSLPAQLVDVNVHPTKREIRFVNSQAIHDLVVKAIRKTLSATLSKQTLASLSSSSYSENISSQQREQSPAGQAEFPAIPQAPAETGRDQAHPTQQDVLPTPPHIAPLSPLDNALTFDLLSSLRNLKSDTASLPSQGNLVATIRPGTVAFSHMRPIGQFQETYLLAEAGDDLFIIDQHAAHERIFYEKLKRQTQSREFDIQQLLFPVSIELSHREQAVLEDSLDMLRQYGLELEPFGGTTYLLKAVPALLTKADYKKLLYDIIDQLSEDKNTTSIEQKLDEVLILMACHAAIRAHQRLQREQITALFQQMDALLLPYTCPHGRPTVLKITRYELEKKFGRV